MTAASSTDDCGSVAHERAHLVALASLPGMGPARLATALGLTAPSEVWCALAANRSDVATTFFPGVRVSQATIDAWHSEARRIDVGEMWERHLSIGVEVLVPGDDGWPIDDAADPDPPCVLFGLGPIRGRPSPSVAIVGTRRCTRYGAGAARHLAEGLAAAGVAVVSGCASGIDGVAQQAALDAGGQVIGVVGSGLDVVYPSRNRQLWSDLGDHGRLWSEAPLGTAPAKWRFPARNRIIASLADVVIVVESRSTGGSLHTVDAAIDRDRLVMAVPGPIDSAASVGTNRLLLQGCSPVTAVEDITAALGFCAASEAPLSPVHDDDLLDSDLRKVVEAIGSVAASIDQLVSDTGLDVATLLSRLGRLQTMGVVRDAGGWWQRG